MSWTLTSTVVDDVLLGEPYISIINIITGWAGCTQTTPFTYLTRRDFNVTDI